MDNLTPRDTGRTWRQYKRVRRNAALVKNLIGRLKALDDRIYTLRSPEVSGMPRGGDPVTLADLVADKADLEARIKRLTRKGREYKREIMEEIDDRDLDLKEAELLELYLVECMSVPEIAVEMGYSERQAWRIYKDAKTALLSEG